MKTARFVALAAATGIAGYAIATTDGQPRSADWPAVDARVASVIDGDTVRLLGGDTVRLVQIDSPEARDGAECYGVQASDELRGVLPRGMRVRLERDPALDDVDEHGRLLRYVFAGERNVNLHMVRAGAAGVYLYRGARGRYADDLMTAALTARREKAGLWGVCHSTSFDPRRGLDTGPA